MKLIILTIVILIILFIMMGIRVWFKGAFPETEISRNKEMKKKGIMCARQEERLLHEGIMAPCDGCTSHCAIEKE